MKTVAKEPQDNTKQSTKPREASSAISLRVIAIRFVMIEGEIGARAKYRKEQSAEDCQHDSNNRNDGRYFVPVTAGTMSKN